MRKSSKPPSLHFCYSAELHAKTIHWLDTLENAEDPTQYRDALGELVVELTDTGMDYYFLKPLQLACLYGCAADLGEATSPTGYPQELFNITFIGFNKINQLVEVS